MIQRAEMGLLGTPLPVLYPLRRAYLSRRMGPVYSSSGSQCSAYCQATFSQGIRRVSISIASQQCLRVSIGYSPLSTMSAKEQATLGNTSPGQSQRVTRSVSTRVWKCFVFPGMLATPTFFRPISAFITLDFPTFGYPTNPTSIPFSLLYPKSATFESNKAFNSYTERSLSGSSYSETSMDLSSSAIILALKKAWSRWWKLKYQCHPLRTCGGTKSLLLMSRKDRLPLKHCTYFSSPSHRKNKGSLASTIWTSRSDLQITLQSCLQTSTFFSQGVMWMPSSVSSIWASFLRQSKQASFSACSSSSFLLNWLQFGRIGSYRPSSLNEILHSTFDSNEFFFSETIFSCFNS